jgi:exonuclease VII small subunit
VKDNLRETAKSFIREAERHLEEACYRIENCIDRDETNATAALSEVKAARSNLDDVKGALRGLSASHEAFEGEVVTLREMLGEYESKTAELEEAVRYLTEGPDDPVDDWK